MASMEDLIATISGGLHAGQQGNDLRDLHAKLAQTINTNAPHPHYRPIPPPTVTATAAASSTVVPPAPASSWNTPPPNTGYLFGSPNNTFSISPSKFQSQQQQQQFSVPMPNSSSNPNTRQQQQQHQQQEMEVVEERPYHTSVLPVRASPKETSGFAEDAFKPLWENKDQNQWHGFKQKGS